jgi:hypothetical protein
MPDWSAQETLQFLMKRVDDFVGATRQFDDITCLVFRANSDGQNPLQYNFPLGAMSVA